MNRSLVRTRRAEGFTMTETLVALAILSLMATLLLGGVTTATQIARATQRRTNALDDVLAAQTILRDKILHLRPVKRLGTADAEMDVVGTEQIFDFFGPAPLGGTDVGPQKYRLLLTSPGDLVLYHVPDVTERADPALYSITGWTPMVLLHGAANLSITYFGRSKAEPERKWRTFWRESGSAPELVRIRVGFAPDDQRVWPDFVVRPGPTIDLQCDPADLNKKCGKRG
jgi:prepilin-type N-terminal cleavage/methylation domain-containing protein